MLSKDSKIYIAGHHGLVGSAIWNNLKKRGYNNMLSEVAAQEGYIKPEDVNRLIAFRNNPSDESWIGGAK